MKKVVTLLLLVGILAGGSVSALYLWPDDPLDLLFDPEQAYTFEGAMVIAERLDRIADELEMPPLPTDSYDLFLLAVEIIPFYHYERISQDKIRIPAIRWSYYPGDDFFHVLGRCKVGENPYVTINLRYDNPWSSWYGKPGLLATLVHELGHAQGIFLLWDPLTEPATQLATLEILAAMARDGNPWALPAFLRVMEEFAVDYAWSLAIEQDRMDEFGEFLERLDPSIYSRAKFDRSLNHWADNMRRLEQILENYGKVPYILAIAALNAPDYHTERLVALPNETHRMTLNDTAWALQNAYQMARQYGELLERFEQREG